MASTISGANSVSRSTRLRYDALMFSAAAKSVIVTVATHLVRLDV
jgi:hypothetical protein